MSMAMVHFGQGYKLRPTVNRQEAVIALCTQILSMSVATVHHRQGYKPIVNRREDVSKEEICAMGPLPGTHGFEIASASQPSAAVVLFKRASANLNGCCRDVTNERKAYPSFAPEDFPAVYKASQKALKTATKAIGEEPDSQVKVLISARYVL